MTEVSAQLDYSVKNFSHGDYKLRAIQQQSGGQSMTIGSSSSESEFHLPPGVYNPSESNLSVTVTPTAAGVSPFFNYLYRDCLAGVEKIQARTASGTILCDINWVGNFTKQCLKAGIKLEDLRTMEGKGTGAGVWADLIGPSNAVAGATTAGNRYDNTAADVSYSEPRYLIVGADASDTPVVNFKIRLGDLKDTFFSINKSLFFAETVIVKVTWADRSRWGWIGTSATVPATGAAALAQDIKLSNLNMFVAQEQNTAVISAVKSTVITLPLPMVYSFKSSVPGTDETVNISITPSMGKTLKRVYHAVYPLAETINGRFNTSNIASAKFTSYVSSLDATDIQARDVVIANGEAWMINRPLLRGSVLGQSANLFNYNFVHIDAFDGGCDDENMMVGREIPMHGMKYAFTAKGCVDVGGVTQFNHYDFVVCQKVLTLSSSGISVK